MPQPLVTRIGACQSGEPPVILLIEDEPLVHMAERSERLEWVKGRSAGAYRRRSSRKRAAILSQRTSA
jgi:hypothetical protein